MIGFKAGKGGTLRRIPEGTRSQGEGGADQRSWDPNQEDGGVLWPLLFDQIQDGICISKPGGRILYMNPAAKQMMGLSAAAVGDKSLCDLLCGNLSNVTSRECASHCPLRDFQSDQEAVTFRGDYDSVNRKLRVRCLKMPTSLMDSEGPDKNLTLIEDVTAEMEFERQKEDWRNMVAHDLRSPLTSVLGALRVLEEMPVGHPIEPREKELVDNSVRACRRTIELLHLYLDIIKFEAGMMPLKSEPVTVEALARKVIAEHKSTIESKQITIQVNMGECGAAMADSDMLFRVIDNLVDNAVKYAPNGGRITITGARTSEGKVRLSFRDNGPGISSEDLPHIFDRFYQARARWDGRLKGTGLGLAFCREAIKAMRGMISVQSKSGDGAEFILQLSGA